MGRKGAIAQQKGGGGTSPRLEVVLGVLNEDIKGIGHLLHDAKEVNVLPASLCCRFGGVVILFIHVFLVGGG